RSRISESSLALGANTSAFTIGARVPKSSVLRAASASRRAPRPCGTRSSARVRLTTSTPPPPPPPPPAPVHLPATTQVVPPRAPVPSGQRNRTDPAHAPGRTSASTIPPCAGPGSASRPIAARVGPSPAFSLALTPAVHRLRPAARREPHLAEPLEQRHVQLGLFLIAVESQLDQHFALWRRYVARREAIEREYEDVAAARVATAEPG